MKKKTLPIMAITIGDPAGIGPEVVLKALATPEVQRLCRPVLIGDAGVLEFYRKRYRLPASLRQFTVIQPGAPLDIRKLRPGKIDPQFGLQSVQSLKLAADLAMQGQIDAIITAPVQKEALHRAGYHVEGQTELFGKWTGAKRYEMLLQAGELRVLLLSRHLSLQAALRLVRRERVLDRILLGHEFLKQWGFSRPKIAVAGLNPHAGESGIFGREEIHEILPAIRAAQKQGIQAFGPFSADTLYRRAYRGEFDLVIALYHDQAFIPVKMVGFENATTTIVGLPFLRVSVIHGSAFDIAGKGIANAANMLQAIRVASQMACQRKKTKSV